MMNSTMKAVPRSFAGNLMKITLENIADLAGVSLSTASRVINGLPGVSPKTRERVLQVIREYGYQPDPVARSLAAQRMKKKA
jgi:LacI family transcriptional regulator